MLAIVFILSGCVSTTGISHDQTLREPILLGAKTKFDAWPSEQWWKNMQDPTLNQLIELAVKDNPDVVQASKRLDKAKAYTDYVHSALSPEVTANANVIRQRLSENAFYPPPYGGSYQSIANASLNATWDLDFWGKNRSELQAALSKTLAAEAEQATAKMLIATSVAQTYYQLARQIEQQKIANQTLKQREQELKLIKTRLDTGLDTNIEVEQGQGNIQSARIELLAVTESVNLTRNALSALTLQEPHALDSLNPLLPELEARTLPEDVPIDLISRRPDLVAARAIVDSTSADIKSVKADFYPNVSLSAFIGLSSFGLSRFLELGSGVIGAGPALHLPVFDGGRLRANLQLKNADFDIAIARYNSVLLQAIHDVADQITSVQSVRHAFKDQQDAVNASKSAYELARIRHEVGLTNYLTVLYAGDILLRERSRMVNLQARALELNISLIKSLGGGYIKQVVSSAQLNTIN